MILHSCVNRRAFCFGPLIFAVILLLTGCSSPWLFRGKKPDLESHLNDDESPNTRYVGSVATAWGNDWAKVEGIALVTRLAGTGSDPRPSPLNDRLIAEMQTHQVRKPKDILASSNTAMVLVGGYMPPGIQKGEPFDIEVRVPRGSETTSLSGGYLMQARLRPMEILGNGIKTGHVIALSKGPLLVESTFKGEDDRTLATRARVLGGGIAKQSRPLGLLVSSDANIIASSVIAVSINQRFFVVSRGVKQNVATAKNDRRIDLAVPRQYKHNITRYLRVVKSIAIQESARDRMERIKVLELQLLEPTTAAAAALRLEAIGEEAVATLMKGLHSKDEEVRFYSAEALAYLEKSESAQMLADLAKAEPAFRWHSMTALVALDDIEAGEMLNQLLHVSSAETRYGAFRAIQTRSPDDPLVKGEVLRDGVKYHPISSNGEPMIHFSRSRQAEIVLFGLDQLLSPGFIYVNNGVTVKGVANRQIKIIRFVSGHDDLHETCSNRVDEVIRSLAKVGLEYSEILDVLSSAKDEGHLDSRIVIDALPRPGRRYVRGKHDNATEAPEGRKVASPIPELFNGHPEGWNHSSEDRSNPRPLIGDLSFERGGPRPSFFGRMKGWFSKDTDE